MKVIGASLVVACGFLFSVSPSFAHMYDSIGVEAGPHSHGNESVDSQFENNCFIDPKLGPVCK